jgi:hypothetical protein
MDAIAAAGIAPWKITLLVSLTLVVIGSAHVHSAREAWSEMRAKSLPTRWRQVLSFLARHEKNYARRMPMMIAFVLAALVVVVRL